MTGSNPCALSHRAATMPDGPPPMMATWFDAAAVMGSLRKWGRESFLEDTHAHVNVSVLQKRLPTPLCECESRDRLQVDDLAAGNHPPQIVLRERLRFDVLVLVLLRMLVGARLPHARGSKEV